jgi:hypothetical protein
LGGRCRSERHTRASVFWNRSWTDWGNCRILFALIEAASRKDIGTDLHLALTCARMWKKTWCSCMNRDDSAYLKHILDAIFQIEEYLGGVSLEHFRQIKL